MLISLIHFLISFPPVYTSDPFIYSDRVCCQTLESNAVHESKSLPTLAIGHWR